jgi:hypothetical protein
LECTGHTSLLRSNVVKSDCRSYHIYCVCEQE